MEETNFWEWTVTIFIEISNYLFLWSVSLVEYLEFMYGEFKILQVLFHAEFKILIPHLAFEMLKF